MSMRDMLDDEPSATLRRQASPGEVDQSGLPLHGLQDVRPVQGRFVLGNARQVEAWRSLAIEADYEFITFDPDIRNGDFILSKDSRLFRVTGAWQKRYGKGTLETYLKYPCLEERRV